MSSSPFKRLTLNLPFHNFDTEPSFTGIFNGVVTLGQKEKFDCAIFTDVETGEEKFITMSYAISHSIEDSNADEGTHVFEILFKGKTEVKGKPFNQFDVAACTVKEYEDYKKSLKKSEK